MINNTTNNETDVVLFCQSFLLMCFWCNRFQYLTQLNQMNYEIDKNICVMFFVVGLLNVAYYSNKCSQTIDLVD